MSSTILEKPLDFEARKQALNTEHSFIIQAPAGSGKTEILIQRYLALLEKVNNPEEILAITFTRKAAGEMKERIVNALEKNPHNSRFKAILENPNRLQIMTIDALCNQICKRNPLVSGISPNMQTTNNPDIFYRQCVEQFFLMNDPEYQPLFTALLVHLDNQTERLMTLLTELLQTREQWLSAVIFERHQPAALRKKIEMTLQALAQEKMRKLNALFPTELKEDLLYCLTSAADYLHENDEKHNAGTYLLKQCHGLKNFPLTAIKDFNYWKAITHLLLTQDQWRKRIDKNLGFPPKTPAKNKIESILNVLKDSDALRIALNDLSLSPSINYADDEWQILEILIQLLPPLTAHLQLLFREHQVCDFIEVGLGALRALGSSSDPSEYTFNLEYQIHHLLVDEFQDTSIVQFQLIERLTATWQPHTHKSIFLVGDPMQSIYRFRGAEVGIFLRAKEHGIGEMPLQFLSFSQNFRSTPEIIQWTNQVFTDIFPRISDIETGAVPYSLAAATKNSDSSSGVTFYGIPNGADDQEAQQVVAIIENYLQKNPQESIAVLVKSRSHLKNMVPLLQNAQINYEAVELESLQKRFEIQDLQSLARALFHLGDRISWFAILRAPWCGLTLSDLLGLAKASQQKTIWQTLENFAALTLSPDGKKRLNRILPMLRGALESLGRIPFSELLKNLWLNLGGPATLENSAALENTKAFFRLLIKCEIENPLSPLSNLNESLTQLFAENKSSPNTRVFLMTIHKAKGLEFDHVIIPGLAKATSHDKKKLLTWLNTPNQEHGSHLIMAALHSAKETGNPIYDYVRYIENQKLSYENTRLLYVAATRAKKTLHLISQITDYNKKCFMKLLEKFYPQQFDTPPQTEAPINLSQKPKMALTRLTTDWQPPIFLNAVEHNPAATINSEKSDEVTNASTILGTVVHEMMYDLSWQNFSTDLSSWILQKKPLCKLRLQELGMPFDELNIATDTIIQALTAVIKDPKAQWIFSSQHLDAHSEYALSASFNGKVIHVTLDRCFIDAEGIRWIVDYKTSPPGAFLEEYQQQLQLYAQVLQLKESREVRMALYYPLHSEWLELKS